MASFFSFSSPIEVDVHLEHEGERQSVEVKGAAAATGKGHDLTLLDRERCPVYYDGEAVRGQVRARASLSLSLSNSRRLTHSPPCPRLS